MNGADVEVERLALRLHGVHPREAEKIARLVADGLAAEPGLTSAAGVKATVAADGAAEDIARSVVIELRRQLEADR